MATLPAEASSRIVTLDIVRGVAVMGILTMNIVAFAMPFPAYANPAAYGGDSGLDLASWLLNFILFDGKMRGLFSILFGASTLLVIDRATRAGRGGAAAHYARMAVLLLFGLLHFYLLWFGDILALYALCGMVIYLFRNLQPKALVAWAIPLILLSMLFYGLIAVTASMAGAPGISPEAAEGMAKAREAVAMQVGADSPKIASELELYRGSYASIVDHRLGDQAAKPFMSVLTFGLETVGLMLIGMALFKSGFLTGDWEQRRYRRWAIVCAAIAVPVLSYMGWRQIASNFEPALVFGAFIAYSTPFDTLMAIVWAALIIMWVKSDGGAALKARAAAAGRMAFTNYLATSIVMTTLFYGYGFALFGEVDRAALWLPVLGMWLLMLAWSKPWLDRFQYGPFEWAWRSLARWELQPMRKEMLLPAA